jgi:hypothetical protein
MTNKFIAAFERGEEIFTANEEYKVIKIESRISSNKVEYLKALIENISDKFWRVVDYTCDGNLLYTSDLPHINGFRLILPKRKGWIAYYQELTSLIKMDKALARISLDDCLRVYNIKCVLHSEFKYIEVEIDD